MATSKRRKPLVASSREGSKTIKTIRLIIKTTKTIKTTGLCKKPD